jgi:glycosyltransferase involved in cell wall biosynthesis
MIDISAVLTAHREGAMAGVSLRSLLSAVAHAEAHGLEVEILIMLDDADDMTRSVFSDASHNGWGLTELSLKDQGLVRNRAVSETTGRHIAFLDGDDLWSENWLTEAHRLCTREGPRTIAHPEVDWFFDGNNNLFFHTDQTDEHFDPHFLRFGNYWDALCLAPRDAYVSHPFSARAVEEGFAYEDWLWNMETMSSGYTHRVIANTIHFKRRRADSQTMKATGNKCTTRLHPYQTWVASANIG